jgi:uncharacterized membrane protein YbhN (UPF0104 family)
VTAESSTVEVAAPQAAAHDARRLRAGVIWVAALALLLLGIGLAVPGLRGVKDRLSEARPDWLGAAVLLELASCLGFVATMRLVLKRAPARPVRRLAWAEMAFGAVVPVGGAGGLAVGAWAMRSWGLSWRRILERSAVLFLLTSAVNAVVLVAAGLGVWLIPSAAHRGGLYGLVPALAAIVLLGAFVALPRVVDRMASRRSPSRSIAELAAWVRATERTAFTRDWRLLGAAGYLIFDIGVLWACLHAFGADPPFLAIVLGYQLGYLANVLPVPGGIGVLDGGLLAALLLYGVPAVPAAAAVLLYHAIALWLPTLGGTIAFARLRSELKQG